jgi:hypothetical protein
LRIVQLPRDNRGDDPREYLLHAESPVSRRRSMALPISSNLGREICHEA